MDRKRLKQLLTEYFGNTISREACMELLDYLENGPPEQVDEVVDEVLAMHSLPAVPSFEKERREALFGHLMEEVRRSGSNPFSSGMQSGQMQPVPERSARYWRRVAAVVLLALTTGGLVYYMTTRWPAAVSQKKEIAAGTADILLPDSSRAMLTFDGGRTIELSAGQRGITVGEGIRYYDGSLVEGRGEAAPGGVSGSASIHMYRLATPRGSTYQLTLPDGTRVWLNATSSIRYPGTFQEGQRLVSVEGEAYFEVAHDPHRPFLVQAGGSTVRVLGTHFNISAFGDDRRITTTLVQGSVSVTKNGQTVRLRPGQQAVVDRRTGAIQQLPADIRGALAWKDGYFRFEDEPLPEILAKVSRWYDIGEISYEGVFDERFTGTFRRSKRVSQLFGHLEKLAPVRFEIHERRVKVMR